MGILNRRQAALPSLVAVLLVAIWMMVGYQASLERERVLDGRELELSRLVVAVEEQTLRLFKLTEASVVAASQWIEEHPDVDPASDASFVRLVGGLTRLLDDAVEIAVLDPLGNARKVSSPVRQTLVSAADREYFKVQQRVETRGLFVGNPLQSYFDGRWMVPVSYPVRGKDGKTSVVVAGIHLEHVVRSFEAQRQKPEVRHPLRLKPGQKCFAHYEDREAGKWAKVQGWDGADGARHEVMAGMAAWTRRRQGTSAG